MKEILQGFLDVLHLFEGSLLRHVKVDGAAVRPGLAVDVAISSKKPQHDGHENACHVPFGNLAVYADVKRREAHVQALASLIHIGGRHPPTSVYEIAPNGLVVQCKLHSYTFVVLSTDAGGTDDGDALHFARFLGPREVQVPFEGVPHRNFPRDALWLGVIPVDNDT